MIQVEKLGIYLSKPISFVLVMIYLLQSGLLIYMIKDKFDLERQITFQQRRIGELEEKLQILKAIEDFQIGFSDEEVGELTEVIYSESNRYNYDPMFVLAIILTESSFRKGQQSAIGARGLMQVVPYVGEDLASRTDVDWQGSQTLFEPEANIKLGTFHLFEQILKFGDVQKAIVAYNVGETRLRGLIRQGQKIPDNYLRKVMENYRMLKENYTV
ncbi:MAG TPA: lytic transglycosylase domain-containing protein [candidate division Zixibacteria bacterium]|nr:lytic transglycosylase domain-containing protein [candidate division Zixibacteria bacterium]